MLWGGVLAAVTVALLAVGGTAALQAASIVIGLPLAGLLLLVGGGVARQLLWPGPAGVQVSREAR